MEVDILYSLVISVTVPFRTKFPLESDTETTARTTADLSLFLKFGSEASILALATFWDVDNVMLREYWLSPRFSDRSGALISTSLVLEGARTLSPALCFPTTVKDDDDSDGRRSDFDLATSERIKWMSIIKQFNCSLEFEKFMKKCSYSKNNNLLETDRLETCLSLFDWYWGLALGFS